MNVEIRADDLRALLEEVFPNGFSERASRAYQSLKDSLENEVEDERGCAA